MEAESLDPNALSLSIPLTKSLERLLNRAATARSQSPEILAQRILCDWLLAEGGFKQEPTPKRETRRESAGFSFTS